MNIIIKTGGCALPLLVGKAIRAAPRTQIRTLCITRSLGFQETLINLARKNVVVPPLAEPLSVGGIKFEKSVGTLVTKDEILAAIEIDKKSVPINSPVAGTIVELLVEDSSTVKPGQSVLVIDTDGAAAGASATKKAEAEQAKAPAVATSSALEQVKPTQTANVETTPQEVQKRTLMKKIVDEIKHYYHGFRLLSIDLRISSRYVRKLLKGEQLSRREHQQLVRSTSDLFRLVPFSVFIIVPFMEFLLPVFLKFFPSMLPSTFQTSKDKDAKIKSALKVKIDMAKFLQQTLDEMAFQAKGESHSEEAKKFAKFFEEVRASGAGATNADILKYSKLFEDEITLDSMTRQQLVACCKLLELQPLGTNVFLRFQLKMRLKALKADDEMIRKEGIQSLTVSELQAACRARGMRALGVPIERLQAQLSQWLELSLDEKIPPSLLLLSRALYVSENIPTTEQLKVTIQSLPELAGTEVRYNIGETEGKIDNKTKLEFLKQEEEEIQRDELQESVESFKSNYDEALIDKAEEVTERAAKMNQTTILKIIKQKSETNDLTMEFLTSVEHDLDKMLSSDEEFTSGLELPDEEYDLRELKEEMEEYREEISEKELQRIRESKAARRLSKRVDKLIYKLDKLLDKK